MRARLTQVLTGIGVLLATAVVATGQPAPPPAADPPQWQWSGEASAFAGFNYQRRKFFDFDAWESQNWLMGAIERRGPVWQIRALTMLTFEPFSLDAIGSPQVFQTGETYRNTPIIDFQHPHDLMMQLGADVSRTAGAATLGIGAALVGTPPIGPAPFMHRPSGTENPQAPLGHHYLDSTHVTHGVVTASARAAGLGVEASVFQGREPDERRTDLDLGRLDSHALRLSWSRGAWTAQVSSAWLHQPERLSPYDATKRTVSVAHALALGGGSLAWMAAAGQNREVFGHLESYLLEGTWRLPDRWAVYSRAELVDKDILDAGFHPVGVGHTHRQSRVGAFTLGGTRDLLTHRWGTLGLGADVTGYRVPANLKDGYGSPVSFHAFVRYRARAGTPAMAHHQH
jgi:hypothetical protein